MTPFAAWQQRMGLENAMACARALGINRTHVYQLRNGGRQPSGPLRKLMEVLEVLEEREFSSPAFAEAAERIRRAQSSPLIAEAAEAVCAAQSSTQPIDVTELVRQARESRKKILESPDER